MAAVLVNRMGKTVVCSGALKSWIVPSTSVPPSSQGRRVTGVNCNSDLLKLYDNVETKFFCGAYISIGHNLPGVVALR